MYAFNIDLKKRLISFFYCVIKEGFYGGNARNVYLSIAVTSSVYVLFHFNVHFRIDIFDNSCSVLKRYQYLEGA